MRHRSLGLVAALCMTACGQQGAQGSPGSAGSAGQQGSEGPEGTQGPTGQQGPQGNAGSPGATGPAGPSGAMGAQGSPGPAGEAGAPGGGVVWKDSTGATVRVVAQIPYGTFGEPFPAGVFVADSRGYVWPFGTWDGTAPCSPQNCPVNATTVYTGSGCTGTAYVPANGLVPPRFVFQVADGTYHSWPDAPVLVNVMAQSQQAFGGTCVASTASGQMTLLSDTTPTPAITPPADLFAGPIHPEFAP